MRVRHPKRAGRRSRRAPACSSGRSGRALVAARAAPAGRSRRRGRCDEAIHDYQRAIAAKATEPRAIVRNLHAGLADCLARTGRAADAEREFREELAAIPWSPEGRTGLATLCRAQGRDAEARAVLAGIVTAAPQADANTYWAVVHTFSVLGDTIAAREWASKAREKFPRDPRFR